MNTCLVVSMAFAVATIFANAWYAYVLAGGEAAIECDEPVWEAGVISDLQVVGHAFVLRNSGRRNLSIARVVVGCGCLTVSPDRFPVVVSPGDTIEIACQINLKKISGPFRKDLVVLSDDPMHPQLRLAIQGLVSGEVQPAASASLAKQASE